MRLIDADALEREGWTINRTRQVDAHTNACETKKPTDFPVVDAVEVVRCKDCKYWERDVIFQDGWCRGTRRGDPNWFCADGERREDAEIC